MLRDIEPKRHGLLIAQQQVTHCFPDIPEVQIIHRALLVPHIDIEGKQVDGSEGPATEDFEERGEAIALLQAGKRRRRHGGTSVGNLSC